MSDKSLIEWTDATWNPVRGCVKVSPGCKHCYAETFAERFRGVPGNAYEQGFDPRLMPEMLDQPLRWKRPRTVFVNSMSDLFGEFVPDDYIARVFAVMQLARHHTYQVLTKRAERMLRWSRWAADPGRALALASASGFDGTAPPLPNVWLGVSVEDREYGLPRIDYLRQTPAAVRFLSIEPLLEDLGDIMPALLGVRRLCDTCRRGQSTSCFSPSNAIGPKIDWVIVGGESGPGARPMHPAWVRSIRDQCVAAGVPFFMKQWGQWAPAAAPEGTHWISESGEVWPRRDGERDVSTMGNALIRRFMAKHAAGRVLDGRTWDEMPRRPA